MRWACSDDLKNYFKISDLLGGLSEPQKTLLKINIGIETSEEGQLVPTSVTYLNLISLMNSNSLITGARYIITDFQTIYTSNVFNSDHKYETWGNTINPSQIWHLLVTAVNCNQIDSRVIIMDQNNKYLDYVAEYDVTEETLEDGQKTKGKIVYLRDSNNNSAFYDFKNVKFKRDNLLYYTFSYIDGGSIKDASQIKDTHDNVLSMRCWNNIFLGDTYYNIFEPDCSGNTFLKGCNNTIFEWNSTNNVFKENVTLLRGSLNGVSIQEGDRTLSTAYTKIVHKSNDETLIVYLDPITYTFQFSKI